MKNVLIITALAAALIGSILWGISEHRAKEQLKNQIGSPTKAPDGKSTIVTVYRDTSGKQHIVFKDHPQPSGGIAPGYVDSLQKGLNIAANKITEVTVAKISAEGQAKLLKTQIDSLQRKLYSFESAHLQATYREGDSTLHYKYHLTLNDVGYKKLGPLFGLLGSTGYYHDIFTDDKDAIIDGERYTVTDYVPQFSVKLQARTFYGINTGQFTSGFGIDVAYKRLTGTWGYFYRQTTNQWTQSVGLKFDILRYQR